MAHHYLRTRDDSPSQLMRDIWTTYEGSCYAELNPKYTVANPDIAGIGVIASFIASASIVISLFGLSEATSCIARDPSSITPQPHPCQNVRKRILHRCRRLGSSTWLLKLNNALPKVVFVLGSQQLVIGTFIMASAIYLRNQRRISTYHLQIAVDLGWLCSNAYVLSSLLLRRAASTGTGGTMRESKSQLRFPRFFIIWHTLCVPVLLASLIYAAALSGTWKSEPIHDERVASILGNEVGNFSSGFVVRRGLLGRNVAGEFSPVPPRPRLLIFQWTTYIANIVFVAGAYIVTSSTLLNPTFNLGTLISYLKVCKHDTPQHRMSKRISKICVNFAVKSVIVLLTIVASDIFHMLFHVSSFVIAATSTIRDRNAMHAHPVYGRNVEEENRFGFGQMFSLLLLVFPLITLGEAMS